MIIHIINALILIGIMWVVARHEADLDAGKAGFAVALISILNWGLPLCTMHILGWWCLLLAPVCAVFILHFLCWMTYPRSILVTFLFYIAWAVVNISAAYVEAKVLGEDPMVSNLGAWYSGGYDEEDYEYDYDSDYEELKEETGRERAFAGDKGWQDARKEVHIKGVGSSGADGNVIMINNEIIEEGKTFALEHKGKEYRWIVTLSPLGDVELTPDY